MNPQNLSPNTNIWKTYRIYRTESSTETQNFIHILDYNSNGYYAIQFTEVQPSLTVNALKITATTILLRFDSASPTVIKWRIERRNLDDNINSTFVLIGSEVNGNQYLDSGLTKNTRYVSIYIYLSVYPFSVSN